MKMKYLALSITLLLTACGESDEERQQKIINQQQQQLREQQQMYQQQQTQVQPQVIQQPAAPVVVQAAPQHDNTLMNMAMGAMIGHALTGGGSSGSNDTHVIERKTVIINNHPEVPAPVQTSSAPVTPVQSTPKPSAMDMNKLSGASSFSTRPVSPVRQSMNMSKLSSKR
jgi:hypothetical protein